MAKIPPKNKTSATKSVVKKPAVVRAPKGKGKPAISTEKESTGDGSGDDDDESPLSKELKDLEGRDFTELKEQIESEYQLAWWSFKPKFDEWCLRLRLYNNQRKDKEAVGDTTMFTIHQTVLASLYDDRLTVTFQGRESGDDDIAENDTIMAEFDNDEMEKDMLDYNWDWDATFYGTGLVCLMEYDRDAMLPIPEYWNRLTTLVDPRAKTVNGDKKGRGRAKFMGREVRLSKYEMEDAGVYFNYSDLKNESTASDINSFLDQAEVLTQDARGYQQISKFTGLKGDTADHRVLEWFTIYKGKRIFVTLAENRTKVIRYHELKGKDIPIIDRRIYPLPMSFDGISIPDLTEDKQRARAVLTNLGLKGAKANIHPMYLFNTNKIKNRGDLNFGFNKFIPVDGDTTNAVQVMPKDTLKQEVQYIMNLLDEGAQKATATPDIQQGNNSNSKRTATELSLQTQKVDTRYSLSAKIFGWSEKRFWQQWLRLYKEHFKEDIDEKVTRVVGALGAEYRPFRREDIVSNNDLDVYVESRVLSDAKRFNEAKSFEGMLVLLQGDPTANMRYGMKHLAKLKGLKRDQINLLMPPTIEELRAEDENKVLEKDGLVEVLPTDDHITHLEIHNKLSDTPAKFAHINAHKRAMLLLRARPDLFPNMPPSDTNPQAGQEKTMVVDRTKPVNEAAITL